MDDMEMPERLRFSTGRVDELVVELTNCVMVLASP